MVEKSAADSHDIADSAHCGGRNEFHMGRSRSKMTRHIAPHQCLAALVQQVTDGGRSEYLDQESRMGTEHDPPKGDCAIVAAVYATFQRPSGQAYGDVRLNLRTNSHPRVFDYREYGESVIRFVFRRIRQCFRSPNMEPMHGTHSRATLPYLQQIFGYQHIHPNAEQQWFCICGPDYSYFIDMTMPGGGHAICVQQGIAFTTIPFDPEEIEVVNVLALGPQGSGDLRANRQYKQDHEAWLDRMLKSGDLLWDWSSQPKMEDYRTR